MISQVMQLIRGPMGFKHRPLLLTLRQITSQNERKSLDILKKNCESPKRGLQTIYLNLFFTGTFSLIYFLCSSLLWLFPVTISWAPVLYILGTVLKFCIHDLVDPLERKLYNADIIILILHVRRLKHKYAVLRHKAGKPGIQTQVPIMPPLWF